MRINTCSLVGAMCRKNVSQSELARGAGVTEATISTAVNGKRALSVRTINKIARFLEVEPEELVWR
jgi:transcriptional regulator with XRE-family HTH domain